MAASVFLIVFFIENLFKSEFSFYKVLKFTQMNSLFILIFALYLFNLFKNMKIVYKKYINIISASTFGVYLIHEHVIVRQYLWNHLVNFKDMMNSSAFIIYAIIIGFSVYIGCIIVDKILNTMTNKPIKYLIDKIEKLIDYIKTKKFHNIDNENLNLFEKV